jgi:hypothetical protein
LRSFVGWEAVSSESITRAAGPVTNGGRLVTVFT